MAFWLWFVYWFQPWLDRRCGDGPITGFLWITGKLYARLIHRVRYVGFENLPPELCFGSQKPVIVIANHTAGIDPVILQTGLHRHLRWFMWAGNMHPALDWAWKHEKMIPVKYGASDDAIALRVATRHLRAGGALGIFPEGAIARPPKELRPFQPGVALLARLGKAPIAMFWIHDTPYTESAWGSLFQRSHSVIEFLGMKDFSRSKDPEGVAEQLRLIYAERSGWTLNEESLANAQAMQGENTSDQSATGVG